MKTNTVLISYKILHKYIGFLSFLLPLILLYQNGLKDSISICYYTKSRDIFELVLGAIGFFFICNKGWDISESVSNKLAGICMILIGLCGCQSSLKSVHYICAILLFSTLGYISFFLFTKTKHHITENKKYRNIIYRTCGILIWFFLFSIIFLDWFGVSIMISESLLFFTFAIAWLIQGEVILKD